MAALRYRLARAKGGRRSANEIKPAVIEVYYQRFIGGALLGKAKQRRAESAARRVMKVKYSVPTSDLAEDQAVAAFLGASPEDAMRIDAVQYSGASWAESPELRCYRLPEKVKPGDSP